MTRTESAIRKGRVAACFALYVVVYIAAVVVLNLLVGIDDAPWWVRVPVLAALSLTVAFGIAYLLRPWYRPGAKRGAWTEDRL